MRNTTPEYKQAHEYNSTCITKANIILKNGTLLEIDSSSISQGNTKIDDSVTESNRFNIGSAIANKLTLNLNNIYDEFSDYDFADAVITVWVGKQLSGRIEWLKKGVFNASDPASTPSILTLEALDNMSKFDVVYDGNLTFPATLQTIVQYCCGRCGVTMISGQFPNYNYQVSKNPFDGNSNITYRAILSYCAQIAGCYARCNADGNLELKWYDTGAFDGIIDGGVFDQTTEPSYQTGDDLDGGNFTDYSSGDSADGGNFTDALPYHHIYSLASLSVSTEDVMITGIRVTATDSESSDGKKLEGETYLCGVEGYILHIKGNPLIEYGRAKEVADFLGARIAGMRFRPFTASCLGDPSMEAGDAAVVTDRKGNSYYTYLTNISFSTGNYASISCDAEPAARHSADRYSEVEKIVAEIKKDSQFQLSEYAQYVDKLNTLAINAMGYYETTEIQDDGSMIKYMHDKPLLSESTIVYKNSIDGFFWSKDGGQTFTAGIDKNGNAVMNVIAAIGISFDWASGGTLTLGGKDNVNGVLELLNALGAVIVRLDQSGLNITEGTIDVECSDWEEARIRLRYNGTTYTPTEIKMFPRGLKVHLGVHDTYNEYEAYYGADNFHGNNYSSMGTIAKSFSMTYGMISLQKSGAYIFMVSESTFRTVAKDIYFSGLPNSAGNYAANISINSGTGKLYYCTSSSRRYKHDIKEIQDIDSGLLYYLPVRQFIFNDDYLDRDDPFYGKVVPGFIAEEVAEIFPWAAAMENGQVENWNERFMIPAMLKLIQDQKKQIDDLEKRMVKLERMIGGNK